MKKILPLFLVPTLALTSAIAQAASLEVAGQVSRVIVLPDDAAGKETQFLDNSITGSRFRLEGSQNLDHGMKAVARIEMRVQSNRSRNAFGGLRTDTGGNLSGDDSINLRDQDIYLSGNFGKISLGKGDGAGNETTEVDLSGTFAIAGARHADLYGSFLLTSATPGGFSSADYSVTEVYGSVDAYGNENRLRYDSLNYNGFSFAVSLGQQETRGVAFRYAGGDDGTKYEVAGYYAMRGISTTTPAFRINDERMGISGSILCSNGLNFTASYSGFDQDSDTGAETQERENMWFKAGYIHGKHAVAIDYGETEDKYQNSTEIDSDGDTLGVSYVFTLAQGVDLLAGYREYSADIAGVNTTDVELVTFGSEFKF